MLELTSRTSFVHYRTKAMLLLIKGMIVLLFLSLVFVHARLIVREIVVPQVPKTFIGIPSDINHTALCFPTVVYTNPDYVKLQVYFISSSFILVLCYFFIVGLIV
jgi:hypothetical protein